MLRKGEVTIHGPRKKVWNFLTDPNQGGQCVPALKKSETIEERENYRNLFTTPRTKSSIH